MLKETQRVHRKLHWLLFETNIIKYIKMETRLISESAFEYMLREVLMYESPNADELTNDKTQIMQQQRLENLGYDVGFRLMERMCEKQRFLGFEDLDCVKFICKEFWKLVFGKTIDKLQTNRRGLFVLLDLQFKWIKKYTVGTDLSKMDNETKLIINTMVHFPCGIMRGALANLGMNTYVSADIGTLPSVTFNLRRKN